MMIATRNQVVSGSVESPGHDARPARVRRNKSRPVAPQSAGRGAYAIRALPDLCLGITSGASRAP